MLKRHPGLAAVLAAGALLRLAAEIAYRPALFYSDSWGYLAMAHGPGIVSFAPLRPSGYPVILEVLSVVGNGLAATVAAQHLAGLATVALVYLTLVALGVRRGFATAAAAVVGLDAWAVALEQHILAEAFFGLALMLVVYLSIGTSRGEAVDSPGRAERLARRRTSGLMIAGLALAAAALMKPVALFGAIAWLVWLAWERPGWRPACAAVAALLVPLVLYSAAHAHSTGTFGLTQAEGWFLYGRVGPIASCDGIDVERSARKLCDRPARAADEGQSFFMFNRQSPARKAFGGISADSDKQKRTNAILRRFSADVIKHRPGDYAELVAGEFFRFFRPGPHARYGEDATVTFPKRARIRFDDRQTRRKLFPGLDTHADAPDGVLRAYASVFHTSRPLLALLALVSIASIVLTHRREVFLPLALGIFTLLGTAATAAFALRYLVPVVPLLVTSATLSAEWLGRGASSSARSGDFTLPFSKQPSGGP